MSDDTEIGEGTVKFREYIIILPAQMAEVLDAAKSSQQQLEDREIDNSQYWCWLLMLGLHRVSEINAMAEKNSKMIVEPDARAIKGARL